MSMLNIAPRIYNSGAWGVPQVPGITKRHPIVTMAVRFQPPATTTLAAAGPQPLSAIFCAIAQSGPRSKIILDSNNIRVLSFVLPGAPLQLTMLWLLRSWARIGHFTLCEALLDHDAERAALTTILSSRLRMTNADKVDVPVLERFPAGVIVLRLLKSPAQAVLCAAASSVFVIRHITR